MQKMTTRARADEKPERRALVDVSNHTGAGLLNGGVKKLAAMSSKAVGDENRREKKATAVAPRPALPVLDEFDREVSKDIRYVTEYAKEIHDNYMVTEQKMQPSPRYMDIQTDITPRMRAILIDWLVEVHQKFKMQPQTLYICVNILDRYLERKVVKRDELQLIGCAALWISSKMYVSDIATRYCPELTLLFSNSEEIYSPEVADFVHISDRAFRRADLLEMEGIMLNTLEFKVTPPTHFVFLTRWARIANLDKKQKLFASYCVERMLQEYTMLRFPPSHVAAAAVNLAMVAYPSTLNAVSWTATLEKHSTYRMEDLQECLKEMRNIVADAEHRSLLAVRKKYNTEENCWVGKHPVQRED